MEFEDKRKLVIRGVIMFSMIPVGFCLSFLKLLNGFVGLMFGVVSCIFVLLFLSQLIHIIRN